MKKLIIKIITLALAGCICAGAVSVCAQSSVHNTEDAIVDPTPGPELPPEYVEISTTSVGIKHLGSGNMRCGGSTGVYDGYKAKVVVELQQYYSGDWHTIATWSDYDYDAAIVSETKKVSKGYDYRVKATHSSYTSGDSWIESVEKYSEVIWY